VGTSDACRSSDRGNGTNMTSISMSRDAQQQRAAAERTGSHFCESLSRRDQRAHEKN
jgi:hypothetical protein